MNYVGTYGPNGIEYAKVLPVTERPEDCFMGVLVPKSDVQPNIPIGEYVAFTVNPFTAKPLDEKKLKKQLQQQIDKLYCLTCGKTHTKLWRPGPLGPKTLCNACGIKHFRETRAENTKKTVAGQITIDRIVNKTNLKSVMRLTDVKDGVNWKVRPSKPCDKK